MMKKGKGPSAPKGLKGGSKTTSRGPIKTPFTRAIVKGVGRRR